MKIKEIDITSLIAHEERCFPDYPLTAKNLEDIKRLPNTTALLLIDQKTIPLYAIVQQTQKDFAKVLRLAELPMHENQEHVKAMVRFLIIENKNLEIDIMSSQEKIIKTLTELDFKFNKVENKFIFKNF